MSKDQMYGFVILVASIIGIVVYGYLLYGYPVIMLQVTAFVAVAGILAITGWIGYTMATTPPPAPLDVAGTTGLTEIGTQASEKTQST